ncbi:thiamine pyrophosphate-binding protein [Paenibacillus sp. J5C_2022]|uniref:thiamine pyrophosphate-binding protein n=1 Tax=Paenibacillus sp. J5C2022 TaxID=2977129 RepID=UPI0021CED886|nr:thiamine pyrophosphate-binding protein [Paenibacillus sp. J5C2022]MCU6708765.1 thiamine pyrophosphate-binding protein [Paenibacillus sp. J5C2022]
MKKRVYSIIVDHLKSWGVKHVFGIPGKSISPLMLELDSQEIQYVLGRHETGCGYEASGYALGSGTLGVAIGTSGPGGTNLITAAGQAREFQLPVLFITGQPSMQDTGRALSQDSSQFGTDLVKMFEPVTLFSARIERGDLLPLYLRHAIEKAYAGEKGPVHLCIPFDVLMEEIADFHIPLPDYAGTLVSDHLERAADMLEQAKRPVLFLGKGAMMADALEEVQVLAEHWRIPVVTAPGGKAAFPTTHPLYLGGYGLGGTKQAMDYMKSGIDLMVVVGSKLCDMSLSGFTEEMEPERMLQFEYALTFAGKSVQAPTEIVLGDMKRNLQGVIALAGARRREEDYRPLPLAPFQPDAGDHTYLSARDTFKALRAALPDDALLFGDAGSHSFYAVQHLDIVEAGTFYFDEVFIAMGAAIGYSIGAKLARPDRTVVCITGDGCMLMHGTEISTAVNHGAGVIFFVLNNGRLDMVEKGMSYNTGRAVGAVYERPLDVCGFAASMGADVYCCRNTASIAEAVQAGMASGRATVVEVMVDPQEIPPILTRLLSLE